MSDTEKLIELMKEVKFPPFPGGGLDVYVEHQLPDHAFKAIADHLATNGFIRIVRCRDCKHWHEETGWCNHHSHFIGPKGEACHPWESSDWKMLNADDFCSYGERKSDNA